MFVFVCVAVFCFQQTNVQNRLKAFWCECWVPWDICHVLRRNSCLHPLMFILWGFMTYLASAFRRITEIVRTSCLVWLQSKKSSTRSKRAWINITQSKPALRIWENIGGDRERLTLPLSYASPCQLSSCKHKCEEKWWVWCNGIRKLNNSQLL